MKRRGSGSDLMVNVLPLGHRKVPVMGFGGIRDSAAHRERSGDCFRLEMDSMREVILAG